ncbi:MAG TPA: T9SS type A sorting domain-containing protein [Chitinophagales bacterium]|nr:T9SS type A sorting domain-containing protein [Chitinophagales bacterium]HNM31643.1 T9SS type A sorting domain-containing protein [Chitinophagales bacterium]
MKHLTNLFLLVILMIVCSSAQAQSELIADNAVIAPSNLSSLIKSNDKITISELMSDIVTEKPIINVRCAVPLNVQVKYFNLEGNLIKKDSYDLDKGVSELNVNAEGLAEGTYMVQIYSKEGSAVRRFVKHN